MSEQNRATIQGMYEAFGRGDIATVLAALDPEIEWWEAENFIYADGNPYVGPQAVLEGVFARLGVEWEGFLLQRKKFWMQVTQLWDRAITQASFAEPDAMCERSSRMCLVFVTVRW